MIASCFQEVVRMENWRPVIGFENAYDISDNGRVRGTQVRNLGLRRLTDEDVVWIKQRSAAGWSSRKIAACVPVSQAVVCKIVRGAAYQGSKKQVLTPALRRDGYLFVTLSVNSLRAHRTIHSMVAEAFIGPRPAGAHINHIDGNKRNNALENLEYVTASRNAQHAIYELRKRGHKITPAQAVEIRAAKGHKSRKELAEAHGISVHMVTAIWIGKSWALA